MPQCIRIINVYFVFIQYIQTLAIEIHFILSIKHKQIPIISIFYGNWFEKKNILHNQSRFISYVSIAVNAHFHTYIQRSKCSFHTKIWLDCASQKLYHYMNILCIFMCFSFVHLDGLCVAFLLIWFHWYAFSIISISELVCLCVRLLVCGIWHLLFD